MDKQKFIEILKHPSLINNLTIDELREWIEEFPYSQHLRVLLAEKIKAEKGTIKDEAVLDAAMYSPNRAHLNEQLSDSANIDQSSDNHNAVTTESANDINDSEEVVVDLNQTDAPLVDASDAVPSDSEEIVDEEEVDDIFESEGEEEFAISSESSQEIIAKKLQNEEGDTGDSTEDQPEGHGHADTFGERIVIEDSMQKEKDQVDIDHRKFMEWLMTLPAVESEEYEQTLSEDADVSLDEKNVVSEALAELLAKQGHHAAARTMYEKLQLKYPEKSAYFAAQIENLTSS